jgi:hypothetical protein
MKFFRRPKPSPAGSRTAMVEFHEAFRDALNGLHPGWSLATDGIAGPGGAVVRLGQRHSSESEGHVDVQFVLDGSVSQPVELWDCLSGLGSTAVERARFAARLWAQTTAGVLLELKYSQRGEFADHYHGSDSGGFSGWHVIAGAIVGFGNGDSAQDLQQWWLHNPVLPTWRATPGAASSSSRRS